jgi:hypothetical protein
MGLETNRVTLQPVLHTLLLVTDDGLACLRQAASLMPQIPKNTPHAL